MINKAVVVGAGTMGAGIAAHLANAGIEVTLLDVPGETPADRSRAALDGIARQLRTGGFMLPTFAARVRAGNTTDDLDALTEADWIIEAVFEDPSVKSEVYRLIDAHRRPGTPVTSNTSTLPVGLLIRDQPPEFQRDFAITHFFNPPRSMELLELVTGPQTDPAVAARVREAADVQLGKTVLECRDTPGFIANRVGNFWLAVAAVEAFAAGLDVETADAVLSRPFGIPRTGVFGLFDLVGINLVPLIWGSLRHALAPTDASHRYDISADPVFATLLARGLTGRRGPGGFYRRRDETGTEVDEVLDLQTLAYRPRRQSLDPALAVADLRDLCTVDSPAGRCAWRVFSEVVGYCAEVAPEIAERPSAVDDALELGYGWQQGPFALANRVGCAWIAERLSAEARRVPALLAEAAASGGFDLTRPPIPGVATVAGSSRRLLAENGSARLHDLGERVACLELRTKMNVCDPGVLDLIERTTALGVEGAFGALVIASDNPRSFSAGANLNTFADLLERQDPAELRAFTVRGQQAFATMRRAPFPVVAAARGVALGGGCELLLTADRVVAHAELRAGFPERQVGLIPTWGGVTQALARTDAAIAFRLTAESPISSSAFEAQEWGLLRSDDLIVMNSRRVLARAIDAARALIPGYVPPVERPLVLHNPSAGRLDAAWVAASETDRAITGALARMLTAVEPGETVTQDELMAREVEAALSLVVRPGNQDRVRHMIATNRPLAN